MTTFATLTNEARDAADTSAESARFASWAAERRKCPNLIAQAEMVAARWEELQRREQHPCSRETPTTRRGRPASQYENRVTWVMELTWIDDPNWLDDLLRGSIASSVGAHNGKLNVRISDVRAALRLKMISAAKVKRPDMSERTARSIAQAARHAASGIACYLDRRPEIKERLLAELALERSLMFGQAA